MSRLRRIPPVSEFPGGTGTWDETTPMTSGVVMSYPLTYNLIDQKSGGSLTFDRNGSAAIFQDCEGLWRSTKADEPAFWGARRVERAATLRTDSDSISDWTTASSATVVDATTVDLTWGSPTLIKNDFNSADIRLADQIFVFTAEMSLPEGESSRDGERVNLNFRSSTSGNPIAGARYATLTTERKRYWCRGTFTANDSWRTANIQNAAGELTGNIHVWNWQVEEVTGQRNKLPSEYIDSDTDYGLDGITGVRYFDTYNRTELEMNLIEMSEDASAAQWTLDGVTVGTNATTNSDGDLIADELIEGTGTSQHRIYQQDIGYINAGDTFCVQVEMKQGTGSRYGYLCAAGSNRTFFVCVDLSSGEIVSNVYEPIIYDGFTGDPVRLYDYGVEDKGNGWYRVWVSGLRETYNNPTLVVGLRDLASIGASLDTYTGDGTSSIYVSKMQMNIGPYPFTYQTTGTTLVDTNVVIDKPGKPIQPTKLKGILNEYVQTNLITDSRDMTGWSSLGTPGVTYDQVGIDGQPNSSTAISIGTGFAAAKYIDATVASSTNFVSSQVFIKRVNDNSCFPAVRLRRSDSSVIAHYHINRSNGAYISANVAVGTEGTDFDCKVVPVKDMYGVVDWWRVIVRCKNNTGLTSMRMALYPANGTTFGTEFAAGGTTTFDQAMVVDSPYITTPVTTSGGTATRNRTDLTGTWPSGLVNDFVLNMDFTDAAYGANVNQHLFHASVDANNRCIIWKDTSNSYNCWKSKTGETHAFPAIRVKGSGFGQTDRVKMRLSSSAGIHGWLNDLKGNNNSLTYDITEPTVYRLGNDNLDTLDPITGCIKNWAIVRGDLSDEQVERLSFGHSSLWNGLVEHWGLQELRGYRLGSIAGQHLPAYGSNPVDRETGPGSGAQISYGAHFDIVDDAVLGPPPYSPEFLFTDNDWEVCTWMHCDTTSVSRFGMGLYLTTGDNRAWAIQNNNNFAQRYALSVSDDGTFARVVQVPMAASATSGEYVMFCGIANFVGTSLDINVNNGEFTASGDFRNVYKAMAVNANFAIGRRASSSTDDWPGGFSNAYIYNRLLNGMERSWLYNNGAGLNIFKEFNR